MPIPDLSNVRALPAFLCHKLVQAAQILRIRSDYGKDNVLELAGGMDVSVTPEWEDRHNPQVGGYYVRYEDGYASYSPPAAFESGYRPVPEPAPAAARGNFPLENNFRYHAPFGNQPQRYEFLRAEAKRLAEAFQWCCPHSRELSLAMTNLEQAVMWANAAIARNEIRPVAPGPQTD